MNWIIDAASGARCGPDMVRCATAPVSTHSSSCLRRATRFPVILHRTPYGIAAADARDKFDVTACLAAEPGRADARLDPARLARDCRRTAMPRCTRTAAAGTAPRARTASMPTTRRTATTRSNGSRRSPGPTAGSACRAPRPARRRPSPPPRPAIRACARFSPRPAAPASMTTWSTRASRSRWSGCGCGWRTTSPASRASHRAAVMQRFGIGAAELDAAAERAAARYAGSTRRATPSRPFIGSPDWMHLPLAGYPDFATWQPFLDEIISHPAPDEFRARHNFRRHDRHSRISRHQLVRHLPDQRHRGVPGHPGAHRHPEAVDRAERALLCLCREFLAARPVFRMVRLLAEGRAAELIDEPAVFYSPRAWVDDRAGYRPDDWQHAERWPPPGVTPRRLYLRGDGSLGVEARGARHAVTFTTRAARSRPMAGATC